MSFWVLYMTKYNTASNNYYFVVIAMVAALAGILFGYDTGVISGAILYINNYFHLTPFTNGIVVSAVLLGALLGAAFSGNLTDAYGRKSVLITVAIIFVVGSLATAIANNLIFFILGRIVVGVAIGVASYAAPLYISEIAPPRHRGALVSLNQLAISIGILVSYVVDYIFAQGDAWRMMLGFGVVPALLLLFGMFFLPRSPRWLVSKGHHNKALAVLRLIRGGDRNVDHEVSAIRATLSEEKGTWRVLFSKKIRPVVIIGAGLAILQQVTGINTILYYAPTIFTLSGVHSNTAAIFSTMSIGAIFVLFTLVSLPLIDSLGRRKLLISGLLGMAVGLAMMSWGFAHKLAPHAQVVLHAGVLIYIACFAFSLGPIMWLMIAEIYPLKVRGIGASFATCINWLTNGIVALSFLTIVDKIGISTTFMVYFAMCLVSIIFVYFLVPETKGVTLERIEANLLEDKKWRHLGDK
jgi:sugar porter (SP) family MFS transporter